MARKTKKLKADRIKNLFQQIKGGPREQWEKVNTMGMDFANDNQLSEKEKSLLRDQGMPDFTINRIIPIVEMLNFYATANQPRWQAVGAEGSDIDVAAVFSDLADYIWYISDGPSIYSNAIQDAITKSIGYLLVTVDKDADRGMGEVVIKQPDPFDVFVDPKSRDILFRDAAYIMIRKVLPKTHLKQLYPDKAKMIERMGSDYASEISLTEKPLDTDQADFTYKDINNAWDGEGQPDALLELIEHYEKIKAPFLNVFIQIPPNEEQMQMIQQQVQVQLQEMAMELEVQLKEQDKKMQEAVQAGEMIPERYQLEIEKAQKMMQQQLQAAEQELMSKAQAEATQVDNHQLPKAEFDKLMTTDKFRQHLVDAIPYNESRIQLTCVIGDKIIYDYEMPISEYPLVPIHYKWTGTPFPISAVSPLIGKQKELNKAHQLMVHNASLGSSLRWMYFKGSIDEEYWEKYATAPGALLPVNQGFETPKEVMPAQLSNAFFGIVQEAKGDMEYLAGIYSSMQGDTGKQHETFRGMLAMDEYGTRRIKQWLNMSIEPALQHLGEVIKDISQAIYSAEKRFRIVQPSAIQEERETQINIPMYNDLGEAIGKSMDYASAKFDVRIISGSTLPVNRWAYLGELKELMQLGVVDDIAVLAETDVRNKEQIASRKSLYSQLQGKIGQMDEALKDKEGTIETLTRQLVQAGIKSKVQAAEVELSKKKEEVKGEMTDAMRQTNAEQKLVRGALKQEAEVRNQKADLELKDLQREVASKKKDLTRKGSSS